MRTVVEKREERRDISIGSNADYAHLGERSLRPRSCFYDFGARCQVRVTYDLESERSEFMESLLKEVAGGKGALGV